jgi:dihydroxy-acid dehydratase
MLRAIGMGDEDWGKPQVGVVSSWNEVTPCNLPFDRLAKQAKLGVKDAGGFPIEFVTIAVSDGISMGHEGMRASLVSREVIADSVETVMHAERLDGMVTFAGCDKSLPGHGDGRGPARRAERVPLRRLDPAGPPRRPRHHDPGRLRGGRGARSRPDRRRRARRHRTARLPVEGACGGMFTANTMASAIEALGLALPGSSSRPHPTRAATSSPAAPVRRSSTAPRARADRAPHRHPRGARERHRGGDGRRRIDQRRPAPDGDRPRGRGRARPRRLRPDRRPGPHIADTKPGGRYVMNDLDRIGGVPVVMKELLDAGLLHGDALTVTGRSIGEELEAMDVPAPDGEVVHPLSAPIHAEGGLVILRGSLAPDGAVVKVAGIPPEQQFFEGPARVFDGEPGAMEAVLTGGSRTATSS